METVDKEDAKKAYTDGEYIYIPIGLTPSEIKDYTKTIKDSLSYTNHNEDVVILKWWIHDAIYVAITDLGYEYKESQRKE